MTLKGIEMIIFLYAITMLVTLAGNGFLIYIVWKKPEVRSLTSFMFVNMAIADSLVALVVMPWSISQVHTDGLWMIPGVIGEVMCKGVVYIAYATLTASILCLTFMAIDRYYVIVHPLRRYLWFRKPKLTIPFIWIFSLASMSIFRAVQTTEDYNSRCTLSVDVLGDPLKAILGLSLYLVVLNYLIPLTVICFLYTITVRRLWFHVAPGNQYLTRNRKQNETSKRRVVRMLIIVTCAFSFSWLPVHVFHMIQVMEAWNVKVHRPRIVMFVCFWFGHVNSAINPWLCICLSTKINTTFRSMVTRKRSQSPPRLSVQISHVSLKPEGKAVRKESRL